MLLIGLVVLALAVPAALAQEYQPRRPRNLFEFLFGTPRERVIQQRAPNRPAATPRQRTKSAKARVRPPAEPETPVVEKSQTARTVLVIGDFMGSGLAEGLNVVFAENPEIKVIDRTKGSSGFARPDFFDWPKEIKGVIDAEKPAAIVVMLGSNDRQQMRIGDVREQPLTEAWIKEYEARSTALATAMQASKVPFVWVGQPSFKPKKMLSDILAFNDVYRKAAEAAGGTFVDIWEGFVDENGAFVTNGPDINGQPVRLRSNDGINLTKAGKRKVAFYAEKPLYKILGITPSGAPIPGVAALPQAGPQSRVPVDRTLPVSLNDPELDGGAELLGQKIDPKDKPRTAAERLAIDGIAPDPTPGRADDFKPSTPPPAASAPQVETTGALRR
ncbi:SGNH/GDSL hydrolase family protein [Mesorhizobium sp. 1B3]|uniref:SGNH/GDSL hydrolase family protein n=1 Tax=Mesorhizobium sp. 1B3 TaxID=3243599 RepID=UPI003D985704